MVPSDAVTSIVPLLPVTKAISPEILIFSPFMETFPLELSDWMAVVFASVPRSMLTVFPEISTVPDLARIPFTDLARFIISL